MHKGLITLIAFCCLSQAAVAQERLFKVHSPDSVNGEPRINAWIGVNMKMNGYYNIRGGLQDYDTFKLDRINVFDDDNRQNLAIDLYQTQIRFSTTYIHPEWGKIQAFVESDFWGENGQMRLRKAYIIFRHWQFGQDYEAFGDQELWPNVLDSDGPPSGIWVRVPFIKYFNELKNPKWRYEIALQAPIVDYREFPDLATTIEYNYPTLPEFAAAMRYALYKGHLRLSGILRAINYLENGDENKLMGYGGAFSGMLGNTGESNWQFQYAAGKGISAYLVAHGGAGYDAFPAADGFQTTFAHGGWAAYEYYLSKQVHFNAVWGLTQLKMTDITEFTINDLETNTQISIKNGNASVFHKYLIVNALWDPYPNFTVGIELDLGNKRIKTNGTETIGTEDVAFKNDNDRSASRISFGFMFSF